MNTIAADALMAFLKTPEGKPMMDCSLTAGAAFLRVVDEAYQKHKSDEHDELKHALTALVDMVEMYSPSLANSGAWHNAALLVRPGLPEPGRELLIKQIAGDILAYLNKQDSTFSDLDIENVGIEGRVNLIALARAAVAPFLLDEEPQGEPS